MTASHSAPRGATIPVLETERLRLRAPRAEDFPPLIADVMTDRARFMGGPFTEVEAWRMLMADVGSWTICGYGYWAIEARATGALLGITGLAQPPDFCERELGWQLLPDCEGQGYATEAARAARDFAFGRLGWDTLVSYIHPENVRSMAVAERLGAVRDDAAETTDPEDVVYRHPKPGARP